ncbi:hypothetical protein GCM10022254_02450 [Actinomadura meridiana]|uniref:GtrA/DPMS transmembrane domain-containing protein n=1 Tax=Actinomadura meridiana TaxID=559626 RepID=A0ABP8BSB1_9ACTN
MSADTLRSPARARRGFRLIFTRYTVGSVLAAVASEATLLATYGLGLLGAGTASVAAWTAGAALNYVLNRWWAWGRRGRASLWRELVPYWVIAVASMVLSAAATDGAARMLDSDSGSLRTVVVGGAFLAVYAVMFVVKFVLFHYFVFAPAPATRPLEEAAAVPAARPARRSLHQVPMTTRE